MKTFDIDVADAKIRDAIDYIRERPTCVKMHSDCVYGASVHIMGKNKTIRYRLKNYSMSFDFFVGDSVSEFIEKIRECIANYERNLADAFGNKTVTCHQLSDWMWEEDEDGRILTQKYDSDKTVYTATLVKYARYIPD